jgi:hypothetical protein
MMTLANHDKKRMRRQDSLLRRVLIRQELRRLHEVLSRGYETWVPGIYDVYQRLAQEYYDMLDDSVKQLMQIKN